MKAETLF